MIFPRVALVLFCLTQTWHPTLTAAESEPQYDVAVYGATLSGIAAAVNAAEEGKSVALVERHKRIGGLHASGMGNIDAWGPNQSMSGFFLDFLYENGRQNGKEDRALPFLGGEAALNAMKVMMEGHPIELFTQHRLIDATTQPGTEGRPRLVAFRAENLETSETREFTARVFIDATYEGDLMAAAGANYRVGSEGKNVFNEPSAPEESSGHVMGYNFRVLVTKHVDNRVPFNRPDGYNPERDFPKLIAAAERGEITKLNLQVINILPAVSGKQNLNDYKSSQYEGFNLYNESDDWPEGSPERRREIHELAEFKARSFFYFLANDERMPANLREEMSQYGYPADEFVDNGHFPPWLYVREGRRMVGLITVTENDFLKQPGSNRGRPFPTAVAMGYYPMNSHGTHLDENGDKQGNFLVGCPPFQVPYEAIIPAEVDGLIVPVGLSASQLAFGAIRMEPTWTILGQAAGVAAAQSLDAGKDPRYLPVNPLQKRLHEKRLATFYTTDVPFNSPYFRAVQYFGNRGLFQDIHQYPNPDAQTTGRDAWHGIHPDLALTPDLIEAWLTYLQEDLQAGLTDDQTQTLRDTTTRGQFLNTAHALITGGTVVSS